MPAPANLIATLPHLLVSASAGSGKTYTLVRRFVQLLTLGEPADGIAAMTFTRKAAGEFYGRILKRLAELAEQPHLAAAYFAEAEPATPATDYRLLLRQVTRRLHRLRLGTVDSFFAGMAACLALEMGLPANARVMDEDEAAQARREALDAFLERLYLDDKGEALATLTEIYKQATFGVEEKSVDEALQAWAGDGLSLWEECGEPAGGMWGNVNLIWPPTAPVRRGIPDLGQVLTDLQEQFRPSRSQGVEFLEELIAQASLAAPGTPLPGRVEYFLDKIAPAWDDLRQGAAEITWGTKTNVSGPAAAAMVRAAECLLARELVVRAERSRGLARLMALLGEEYEARVRSRGRLSFADVQRLLSGLTSYSAADGGSAHLWYRLDCRFQHWLLDEFQDTSRLQWSVISQFVHEVVQDAEGRRSFFAVGDPKQSIYLWRQAEPGLFDEVAEFYRRSQRLRTMPLAKSHRSARPVLDAVNAVFGDPGTLEALLPEGCLTGFAFQNHIAVKDGLPGHAALISPEPPVSDDKRYQTTLVAAALLRQVEPLRRGLTCAVLVRQNSNAREVADDLRLLTGMEVICESEQHPTTDNAVTLALISVLKLAAHPGDTLALEHLRMTPLWPQIQKDEAKSWRYEIAIVQSLVAEHGFTAFVQEWGPRVAEVTPELDAFHTRRLAQFADIAAEFDSTGNRDIDAFLEFACEYPLRTRGGCRAIQVMTVHAAKGLEFDMVILPALDGESMTQVRRQDLLVARDRDSAIQWVLQPPPKQYVKLDAVLSEQSRQAECRAGFESLCRLYVAMTRAKLALYLIAQVAPKNSSALKESRLLRELLPVAPLPLELPGCRVLLEWETGQRDWYLDSALIPESAAVTASVRAPLGGLLREFQPIPRRRTPSGEETFKVKGEKLFSADREEGRMLGTLVHALFAEVEFFSESEVDLQSRWRAAGLLGTGGELEGLAEPQVLQTLRAVSCAQVFRQPAGKAPEVWRERSFEIMLDGEWVSGVFDRVLVDFGADGRASSAWIVDFKTDFVGEAGLIEEKVDGYGPQLQLYRRTLGRLLGLPAGRIRTSLIFTRAARLVDVP